MDPMLDGSAVFGTACHVTHTPIPTQVQRDRIFGINGTLALYGGNPGRTFEITGVLIGSDLPSVIAAEGILLSYADGILRTFTDTQGRSWPNVAFENAYQPDPSGPKITDFGWCLPYRCMLMGYS